MAVKSQLRTWKAFARKAPDKWPVSGEAHSLVNGDNGREAAIRDSGTIHPVFRVSPLWRAAITFVEIPTDDTKREQISLALGDSPCHPVTK